MKNKLVQPFVKWAGGKRKLISEIDKYFPDERTYGRYYEPFLGGGAVLFSKQPRSATVNDVNKELINSYNVIKNNVEELIDDLKKHKNTEDYYYFMRDFDTKVEYSEWDDIRKASRMIYLNKTCYNGLYRVNSQGFFNTPFGKHKNPNIVNEAVLLNVSEYLKKNHIQFRCGDYEEGLKGIRKNSFVYLDPPYAVNENSTNFTGYTVNGFGIDEQIRLKKVCDRLDSKGVKFLLSNSNIPLIEQLYSNYDINIVYVNRLINSNISNRGFVEEVLIKNY